IRRLVALDNQKEPAVQKEQGGSQIGHRSIYHIWPDFPLRPLITKSIATVKAAAARASFAAMGDQIVWAVLDSGIDGSHRHFQLHGNLELGSGMDHADFTTGKEDP